MVADDNFNNILMEALNHWYRHKELGINNDPDGVLNSYLQDNIVMFKKLQKEYRFKNIDDFLYETIIIGLADIEREDEE